MARKIGQRSKKAKTAVEIIAEKKELEKVAKPEKVATKTAVKSKKDGE